MSHAHPEGHLHTHEGDHEHGHEVAPLGGPVVLVIGDDVGAMIVWMDHVALGTELFLRPDSDPTITTHTGVWTRQMGDRDVVVAVFAELVEGRYGVLDHEGAVTTSIEIVGGSIAELDLRSSVGTLA